MRAAFEIGDCRVPPGQRRVVDLPVSRLSNHTPVSLPVHVLHGHAPGPALFVSAAVHGDEIIGVEIIRRLLKTTRPGEISGTLLCIPIVNAFGFISRTRYLPDQRDLNRAFPGNDGGSLAAKLAHLFMREVVHRCDVGIDLHSAAASRTNLPQIRSALVSPQSRRLAEAFGAHVVLRSPTRAGSLREAAAHLGKDVLVYEAGEALRFDTPSIMIGVRGVHRVMTALGMRPHAVEDASDDQTADAPLRRRQPDVRETPPVFSMASKWVRSPEGGILRAMKTIGDRVRQGERLGVISNPYDETVETEISATIEGLVIGRTNLPVVNLGDALFHIARVNGPAAPVTDATGDPVLDEDEII